MAVSYKKGDRVLARAAKNEWYAGTVLRAKPRLRIDFDDGMVANVDEADLKWVKALPGTRKYKLKLSDLEVKSLLAAPTEKPVARASLLFVPPQMNQKYTTTFKQMSEWLDNLILKYKFDPKYSFKNKQMGSVAMSRTFALKSETQAKYARAASDLLTVFGASSLWRTQVMAGSIQFYSNDGVFHAAFYNIKDPHGDGRKIGFYLLTTAR